MRGLSIRSRLYGLLAVLGAPYLDGVMVLTALLVGGRMFSRYVSPRGGLKSRRIIQTSQS